MLKNNWAGVIAIVQLVAAVAFAYGMFSIYRSMSRSESHGEAEISREIHIATSAVREPGKYTITNGDGEEVLTLVYPPEWRISPDVDFDRKGRPTGVIGIFLYP